MVVGICVGETSLSEVTFISDKMPKVGEYVTIEYDGKKVLGMIENLIRGNDALNVDILQMVRVLQDGEEVKMSKRSGKAITMRDLLDEVGSDSLRFMFIHKALSTQMDLDLSLAVKQSNDNPVFYAQYAYARIRSLFNKFENYQEVKEFTRLDFSKLQDIMTLLVQYPSVVEEAASKRIPHKLSQFALSLASAFHSYYNDEAIITDDVLLTNEKLTVLNAVAIVLKDALNLVGVNTKEKM